jgi:hypothetical protein
MENLETTQNKTMGFFFPSVLWFSLFIERWVGGVYEP